jgi:hypothetical protein
MQSVNDVLLLHQAGSQFPPSVLLAECSAVQCSAQRSNPLRAKLKQMLTFSFCFIFKLKVLPVSKLHHEYKYSGNN